MSQLVTASCRVKTWATEFHPMCPGVAGRATYLELGPCGLSSRPEQLPIAPIGYSKGKAVERKTVRVATGEKMEDWLCSF